MFSNVGHFHPNITFQGKSRRNPSESSLVRGFTLVSSSLACKCLSRVEVTNYGKNTVAYYDTAKVTAVKCFIVQAPDLKYKTRQMLAMVKHASLLQ